ncbi:segregation and condensation protein A [Portibacter lacus]|uniref:Segregation and condensation protein A n=1 Tax=Portibacter lacus TaxID=1099794 RepID=A0AA37STG0_9BACT|nr:segregation/condensation protein A [Portibacter lacus]GLR17883.1 segregation and condensation protein A [Portibacter lacus]
MSYTVHLQQFEGPFDLLLFFIERDELDINDIPISKLTKDFLDYIQDLEQLDIEVASEFILVAATLMRIKAKMLIPRKALDEEGNEIDPRTELVQKLLEYKQFKALIPELERLEKLRSLKSYRGNIAKDLKIIAEKALVDEELENLTLFNLMKAFQKVLDQLEDKKTRAVHHIVDYSYNVEDQQDYISSKFLKGEKLEFKEVFKGLENRVHAIVTFLALLEMLNLQMLEIIQGEGVNNFWLKELK